MVETQERIAPKLKSTAVSERTHAILESILALDLTTCDITVCLASLAESEAIPQYELLVLHENVVTAFKETLTKLLRHYQEAYKKRDIQPRLYDVITKLDDYEIECLDLSTFTTIQQQIEPLAKYPEFTLFAEEQSFLDRLRFYVMIVQPPNHLPVYFYRHYSAKQMLARSPYLIIRQLWNNNYEYVRLTESAFLFDKYIDCMNCGDDLFIFKKDGFYQVFHYLEDLEEKSEEMLTDIKNCQLIANFDDFAQACKGNRVKMLMLKSISTRAYLASCTPEKLRAAIENYGLPIDIDSQGLMRYDPKAPWEILKLLDDRYVTSGMTGEDYDANSKRRHDRKRKQ